MSSLQGTSGTWETPTPVGPGGGSTRTFTVRGGSVMYMSTALNDAKRSLSSGADVLLELVGDSQRVQPQLTDFAALVRASPYAHLVRQVPVRGLESLVGPTHRAVAHLIQGLGAAIANYDAVERQNACSAQQFSCGDISKLSKNDKIARGVIGVLETDYVSGWWKKLEGLGNADHQMQMHQESNHLEFDASEQSNTEQVKSAGRTTPLLIPVEGVQRAAAASNSGSMAMEIAQYETPAGATYVVSIGGTQAFDPTTTVGNPQDGIGIAVEINGEESLGRSVTEQQIREHIPKGSTIVLAGHSQGGTIMDNLAHDPEFAKDYKIVLVSTYGQPMTPYKSDVPVNTIAWRASTDPVPPLSPEVPADPRRMEVIGSATETDLPLTLDPKKFGESAESIIHPHGVDQYKKLVIDAQASDPEHLAGLYAQYAAALGGATLVSSTMVAVKRSPLTPGELAERSRLEGLAKQQEVMQEQAAKERRRAQRKASPAGR